MVRGKKAFITSVHTFLDSCKNRGEILRRALRGTHADILSALEILYRIPLEERVCFFEELLRLRKSQKFGNASEKAILTLPKEFVMSRIEFAVGPLLKDADHIEHLMVLGMLRRIDKDLCARAAANAAKSPDYDIREVANDFLRDLSSG